MLALPIIGSTYRDVPQYKSNSVFTSTDRSLQPLVELKATLDELNPKNLLESYHDAQQAMDMSLQLFASGMISLEHRAQAEELFWDVCRGIRQRMNLLDFVPRELDELRKLFAETYIGNFSLFQSLRDHWAIGQLFPILPLSGLNERPTMDAVLGDITCDSDGKVNRFVGDKQTRETLPVHHLDDNRPYYLGVFLIGAYQEAIGDRHNLLGQINVVAVDADPAQSGCQPKIIDVRKGDSIASVLAANDQNTDQMLGQIAAMLEKLDSGSEDLAFFQDAFAQYSYLQAQQNENSSAAPLDETLSAPQNSEGSFVSKILNHSAHFKNKTTREKI
jgi:arginine decarboxylase